MGELKAGQQLASVVCETRVVVVRTDQPAVGLTCGGAAMVDASDAPAPSGQPTPGHDEGTKVGKRYVDAEGAIEVLCTRPGAGSLAVDGALLAVKEAKPLPSSD